MDHHTDTYSVAAMTCGNCEGTVRHGAAQLADVQHIMVNARTGELAHHGREPEPRSPRSMQPSPRPATRIDPPQLAFQESFGPNGPVRRSGGVMIFTTRGAVVPPAAARSRTLMHPLAQETQP